MQDPEEFLPSETDSTNDAESYQDIVETTDPNLQGDTEFRKIVAHFWKDGILFLKAQYIDTIQGSHFINTPFAKLRRDEPVPCAKYIREYVVESRRGNRPLNDWALKVIRQHSNIIRRMQRINPTWRSTRESENTNLLRHSIVRKLSRNRRQFLKKNK